MAKNYYSKKGLERLRKKEVRNPKLLHWEEPIPNGYIYVLKNEYIPNLHKVGFTEVDTAKRAKDISRATGVPGEWKVIFDWKVFDARKTEQHIFSKIEKYRMGRSEIFDFQGLDDDDVVEIIDTIIVKNKKAPREYIEQLNTEKKEYQTKKELEIAIKKEVTIAVEAALSYEQVDSKYIYQIRKAIAQKYIHIDAVKAEKIRKEVDSLEGLTYGALCITVLLAFFLQIKAYMFYGYAIIIFAFMFYKIISGKSELKKAVSKNLKDYMFDLPRDLESLKPIMQSLKIKRILNISGIEVEISRLTVRDPNNKHFYLSTPYKPNAWNEKKSFEMSYPSSEKDALISFITHMKTDFLVS